MIIYSCKHIAEHQIIICVQSSVLCECVTMEGSRDKKAKERDSRGTFAVDKWNSKKCLGNKISHMYLWRIISCTSIFFMEYKVADDDCVVPYIKK